MTWRERWRDMQRPATTLADQALVSVANFATVFFFARSLAPQDFGLVALVLSVLLAANGIQTALVSQVHNLLGARREGEELASLTGGLMVVQSTLTAAIVVPGLIAGGILWMAGYGGVGRVLVEGSALLAPWLFQDMVRRFLYTKRHMNQVLLNDGICYGLQLAGAAAVLVGALPQTFETAQAVYMGACLAGSGVGIVQLRRLGLRFGRESVVREMRSAWAIGRYLVSGEALGMVGRNATSWMLAAFMGLPALGAYRAVVHIANVLNPISIATSLYLPALASGRWGESSPAAYKAWYAGISLGLSALLGVVVLGLAVAAGPILDLAYGRQFEGFPIILILQIALASRLVVFVHDTLFHGIVAGGESRAVIFDRFLQLGVLAVAGYPLVSSLGALGAATWHLVSALVLTAYAVYRFGRLGAPAGGQRPETMSPDVIGYGAEAIVTASDDGATVSKRFVVPERAARRAQNEFRMLTRMHAASDRAPVGVRSPRPITLTSREHTIVMERCAGEPLDEYLSTRRPGRGEMTRISRAVADGLGHVIDALGEPYHDFCPQNLLWDSETGTLTVLDLGNDRVVPASHLQRGPFTVSLGCFVGTTAYTAARPFRRGRLAEIRRNVALYRAASAEARRRGAPVSRAAVFRIAWSRYVEMGLSGPLERRAWYLTVGILFALCSMSCALSRP